MIKKDIMLAYIKKSEVAVLISDITDVRAKNIIRNQEFHLRMAKGLIPQEDIAKLNFLTPNNILQDARIKK